MIAYGRRLKWMIAAAALAMGACRAGGRVGPVHAGGGVDPPPTVRYEVHAIDAAVAFYTGDLGFKLERRDGAFAQLSRDGLRLVLSAPGAPSARPMAEGAQQPGGWNRIVVYVNDLQATVERLKEAGVHFRGEITRGPGGAQAVIDDPDGNPVELHEATQAAAR